MGQRRIKFYSVNDMGTGWHLQKMEAFFRDWDILTDNPDVNTILELFNIKKFFRQDDQTGDNHKNDSHLK